MIREDSLEERLQFRPKIWWDPIPPFFREALNPEILRQLAHVQLRKEVAVLQAELQALQETQKLLG